MVEVMNDKYIQIVKIDWDKININSYLQGIKALKNMNTLEFKNNVTFL